ncbi:MAG: hypothetical protein KC731_35580, partial [Myxococcales bacterium]|nr:hypothetical protein [Myxococcales bacterium]
FYHCFGKPIQGDMSAWLPIENGISVSGGGYDDDTQKLGVITFGSDEPWYHQTGSTVAPSAVDEVTISELLRDIESLGEVERAT